MSWLYLLTAFCVGFAAGGWACVRVGISKGIRRITAAVTVAANKIADGLERCPQITPVEHAQIIRDTWGKAE